MLIKGRLSLKVCAGVPLCVTACVCVCIFICGLDVCVCSAGAMRCCFIWFNEILRDHLLSIARAAHAHEVCVEGGALISIIFDVIEKS